MIQSCSLILTLEPETTNPKSDHHSFSYLRSLAWFAGLYLFFIQGVFGQEPLLEKKFSISRQKTTLYDAFNLISDKTGCLFIYDSKIVENSRRVTIEANQLTLKQGLDRLLANPKLNYRVIGRHILIYRNPENTPSFPASTALLVDSLVPPVIRGYVFDHATRNPLPYASIGIENLNQGTITNQDGYFVLKIPSAERVNNLLVSHLGFITQKIPVRLINDQKVDIYLDRRIISIQEVIIRYIDPVSILVKALEMRKENNFREPVYLTTFYREGVNKNDNVVSYSEAVFKVYKSSYEFTEKYDQVKLLKSRKIQNPNTRDTVLLKLKAGVLAGLQLDIVKSLPSFLDLEQFQYYTYTYSDIVSYHDQEAYAITFVQNKEVDEALYSGTIYIDTESFAILGANFEVNPDYLEKAAEDLVQKKSRKLKVKFEKINYSISYTRYNGRYYLNHARCDLEIKTRFRNQFLFDRFTTYMEIAACEIDTLNVERFPHQDVIKPDIVFSDANYDTDDSFWGNYNIITPEARLDEALLRIIAKIRDIR